ncbi:GATA transcription factor 18-like [Olea europaea var. sylvestris]|uniref:GATA transcription factor 18-like n=1 Tax=Olea europaea subsp. europaea TaxID=158383 RepID=A0A8S0RP62_OLEEU|nr:GATA transcription factor 18-like [Olea europaea var. sylvestris]CAA2981055.1 GATA transcription factor 18-like [Olea europaea subsp. europaea]
MMQRCNNSCGQCSCGLYHTSNNSFSMIFSSPNSKPFDHDHGDMYSASSSVDCTLSLGTPSTRLTNENEKKRYSCMSNFGWNILQSKPPSTAGKHRGGSNSITSSSGGDPLLARRCANCDTTSTPLWRNGPRGPKSLCNACGIRFKKEERRATAVNNGGSAAANNSSWVHHHSQHEKMPCFSSSNYANEFRFIEENDHHESENGIPFRTWRFNVTDRPNFVHDFTR